MVAASDVRSIVLSLAGTTQAPHFDRTAFKAIRIYATLAADGRTINLKLTPAEQEFKCMMAPDVFAPVPNAWGKQGWTTVTLSKLGAEGLKEAFEMAWRHGASKPRPRQRKSR